MNRKFIYFLLMLITLILLSGCIGPSNAEKLEIQNNMSAYLKNTYGMDFQVDKPVLTGNSGFGYRYYYADARTTTGEPIEFTVRWDKTKDEFWDNYLGNKWMKQGRTVLEKKLEEVYGKDYWLEEYFFTYNDPKDKDLDYSEIIKNNSNKMQTELRYYVFLGIEDFEKEKEAKRAYKILKEMLIDNNTLQFYFNVFYIDKDKRSDLKKLFNSTKNGDARKAPEKLYDENILFNALVENYSEGISEKYNEPKVKSSTDLINKFKY